MRKIALFSILAFLFFYSAQAQVRFGVKAGLNLATVAGTSDLDDFYEEDYLGEGFNPKMVPSFMIGGQLDYNFGEEVGLGVGLQISGKGFRLDESFNSEDERITYDERTTPFYIQVPVQFQYRNSGFFGAIGPYVGFGIGGRYEFEFDAETVRFQDDGKIEFTNDVDVDNDLDALTAKINPLDFGAGLELGYEFSNLRLTAGYSVGFTNIYPKDLVDLVDDELNYDNFKASNRVITIGAAWMFGE
jgi:hypothetical protein